MPRRGSQGRLTEDAGGPVWLIAVFLAKHVCVLPLVWLLQFELPGLIESFVCGEPAASVWSGTLLSFTPAWLGYDC
jgi:hypothetical protein